MAKSRKSRRGKRGILESRETVKNNRMKSHSLSEIRSVGAEGEFEGYLTVWNTIDSHGSTFVRGCFKKTIEERGSKVKIFYDHEHLVGSSIELREDDHGMYGRGKLNLSVDKAKEAHEFMKDGTLEGLSFSFRTVDEKFEKGVRMIQEVELYEFGPVVFPSNENAIVTNVRSEEVRAVDFQETVDDKELRRKSYLLINSIEETLDDIWWSNQGDREKTIELLDSALSEFHASYLEFSNQWIGAYWAEGDDELRASPSTNVLSTKLSEYLIESRKSVAEIASSTSFTVDELTRLKRGKIIKDRSKLDQLPENVRSAHQAERSGYLETLCSELRSGGLNDSEKRRIQSLLAVNTKSDNESSLDFLTQFNKSL